MAMSVSSTGGASSSRSGSVATPSVSRTPRSSLSSTSPPSAAATKQPRSRSARGSVASDPVGIGGVAARVIVVCCAALVWAGFHVTVGGGAGDGSVLAGSPRAMVRPVGTQQVPGWIARRSDRGPSAGSEHGLGLDLAVTAQEHTYPGSAMFPFRVNHSGIRHDDRCSQAGCDLLVPEPRPPVSWDPKDLPTFSSVCLDRVELFNGRKPHRDHSSPTPTWERPMPPLGVTPGLGVLKCLNLCVRTERCVAWTHDDRKGTSLCVLRPAFAEEPTVQLQPTKAQAKCTSGVVRAGIARWQPPGPPPPGADKLRPDASLRGVPVAELGNCGRRNCLSVPHCEAEWQPKHGRRFAFVLTDDLQRKPPPTNKRPRTLSTPELKTRRLIQAAKAHGADLVYLVPPDSDVDNPVIPEEHAYFNSSYEKLRRGPWLLPPNMAQPEDKGCTRMEMIRFATLGLEDYDAVIYLDSDVEVNGDLTPVFKCVAATDRILYANGPRSPFNMGFFAAKPDRRLVKAFEHYMSKATVVKGAPMSSNETKNGLSWSSGGWDGIGFEPCLGPYITSTCGQGIMPALYFKMGERNSTELVDESWRVAGRERPHAFPVDRCKFNWIHEPSAYSRHTLCEPSHTCNMTKLVHKPLKKNEMDGKGCFYIPKGTRLCSGTWCGGLTE